MSNKEDKEEIEEKIDVVDEAIEEGDVGAEDFVPLFEASQHIIMSMIRDLTQVREMLLEVQPYEAMELLDSLTGEQALLRKTSEKMIELMEVNIAPLEEDETDEKDINEVIPEDINPEKEL